MYTYVIIYIYIYLNLNPRNTGVLAALGPVVPVVKPGLSRVSTNLRIWQSIVRVPQILNVLCVWYS